MSEQYCGIDLEAHRRRWLEKLSGEFVKLEALFPAPKFLPDEGLPKWVENVEREFAATMMPVARIKEGFAWSPKKLGALIGHQCANGVLMMEALDYMDEMAQVEVDVSKITEENLAAGEKVIGGVRSEWYPALRRLAKRALCSVVDQSYEDMTEFLLAYSQAFSRKHDIKGIGSVGTSATEVYLLMLWQWRTVQAMKSINELHQWLVRVLGATKARDLRRTEKLCQRIGLSFRKPGLPKKVVK